MPPLKKHVNNSLLSNFRYGSAPKSQKLEGPRFDRDIDVNRSPVSSDDEITTESVQTPDVANEVSSAIERDDSPGQDHFPLSRKSKRGKQEGNEKFASTTAGGGNDDTVESLKRKREESPTQLEDVEIFSSQTRKQTRKYHRNRANGRTKSSKNNGYRDMSSSSQLKSSQETRAFKPPKHAVEDPPTSQSKKDFKSPKTSGSRPEDSKIHRPRIFKTPRSSQTMSDSSTLSSPPGDDILDNSKEHFDYKLNLMENACSPPGSPKDPLMTYCPMCKAAVPRALLEESKVGSTRGSLRLKSAVDFCLTHKKLNASSQWKDSKYPSIDWDLFEDRLVKYHGKLEDILKQRAPSFYREDLEAKVASGQIRNALRNPEGEVSNIANNSDVGANEGDAKGTGILRLTPGYYGPKGVRRMTEFITNKFAKKLRAQAAKDWLFTEIGVSGFIQAVLMPEMAVMLVCEDFNGCSEERARLILEESAEAGELVNAEEEDSLRKHDEVNPAQRNDAVTASVTQGRTVDVSGRK